MKRTALNRWIPFRLSALVAPLIAAWPQRRAAFLAFTLAWAGAASAASLTWDANGNVAPDPDGGTGTRDVNTTANWWNGAASVVWPAPGGTNDDAIFGNNAGTVSLAAGGVTANDLTFNTTGYVIQSNTLTLNGTTPTITTGTGVSATISSVIAGTSGLTKTGDGTLVLTGVNTYTGGTATSAITAINGGTLQLGSGAVNGTVSGSYQIGAGTTMFLNNATAVQALTGGWASQITGAGTLRLNSAQTVTGIANWGPNAATALPFNSGFTGTLQVDNGRMDSSAAGLGGISNVVINTNAQFMAWNGTFNQAFSIAGGGWGEAGQPGALRVAAGSNATFNGNITLTANAGINSQDGNTVMTINGAISGGFNLAKENGGLLTLAGANTYTGTTTVNSGILNFANTQSFYNGNTGMWNDTNLIVNSGAIAAFRVGGAGEFTIANFDTFKTMSTATGGFKTGSSIGIDTTNAGGTLTYSSVIADNGANTLGFAKLGTGTLVLNGANTYTGNTYIGTGGTLEIAGAAGTLGGGTYNGIISGGGNLVKSSAGTLTLGGANTYTGKTSITGGTLVIGADNRLGAVPGAAVADQLTLNGTTLRINAGAQTLAANRGITISGSGATLDSEALADASGNTTTLAGQISGTGALTIKTHGDQSATGAGSNTIGFHLTNIANNFTGDITITNGLVAYANNSSFGNTANRIILNGGGLLDNNTSIALNREIEVQAGGGTFRTYGTSTAFWAGPVTGSGTINRTDGGTLVLTGNLAGYSGTFNNQSGATILAGTNATIGGNWNIDTSTVSVASTVNQTLAGTVSGAGGFTKSNTGTLTLSGNNTYTGPTSINGGTLAITGSPTGVSAISQNGGTLRLDYGSNNTSKIGDTAVLTLNGGTVTLAGATGTHTELVASTSLNGGVTLNRSGANTAVLALGGINRGVGGALEVAGAGLATTTTGNTNGVLPGVSLAGGLAMNNGSGNIVAYSGAYSDVNRLGGTIADGATNHARIIEAGASGNISLAGAGTSTIATLSNNSTAGLATIDVATGNTLRLGAAGSILSPSTSAGLTISGAGTLTAGGADNTAGGLLVLNQSSTPTTLSALIANNGTGAVTLTKSGSGALSVTGVNTFTGGVNVNDGSLTARINVSQNALGTGPVAVSGGSTLVLNNVSTATGPVNISNVFSGGGNIQLVFADGTTSPRNTFLNGASSLAGFAGNIRLSMAPGATATGDKYTSGVVTTAASVLVDPGTQLFINGAANYFGGITVSGPGNSESRGAIRLGAFTLGGAITLAGDTAIGTEGGTFAGAITSGAAGTQTLTFGTTSSTGNATLNGSIGGGTGSIALVKNQAGIVTLRGPNTYTGGTTINAGILSVGGGGTGTPTAHVTSLGTGNVTVNTGGTLRLWIKDDAAFTIGNNVTLNGGTVRNENGNHTLSGTVFADTAGATFTSVVDGRNLTLSNVVSGPGNVTVTGTAATTRVVFANANTYTGATLVNSGTLSLAGTGGAILNSSGVTLPLTSTLRLDNTPTENAGDRLPGSVPITLNGGTFNFAHTAGAANYAETAGPLTLGAFPSAVTASQAASGQTSALTFASLTRNAGGTVDFTGTGLGADTRNRILFTANPNVDGIIGVWATMNGNLATYDNTLGVREFTGYTDVVRLTGGSKVINDAPGSQLRIVEGTGSAANLTLGSAVTNVSTISQSTIGGPSAATIDLNGQTLRLGRTGGIRTQTGTGALTVGLAANPGVLTAGGTANTAGKITVINPSANTVTINSAITNNGTGTVSVESLSGNLTFGGGTSNTFNGTLDISTLGSTNGRSVTFAKTGGATAIGDNAVINFGLGNTGEANLRMSASGQMGNNVLMNFANPNGAWARFDLMGTNQSLAGINTPTLAATQHGAVIQNRQFGNSTVNAFGPSTLVLNGSGTYQYNGYIRNVDSGTTGTETLAITKSGTGSQTLAGVQIIYTGATTVNGGTLALQDTTAFVSPITLSGTGTLNSIRTVLGFASRSTMLGANISGTGVLNINNSGSGLAGGWTTVGVANGLTMAGTINVNSGTLSRDQVTLSNINTTATVNVAAGAAFGAGRGGNSTIGALNGAGDVGTFWSAANAGSITFGNGDGSGSFSGIIHGNGNATDGNIEGGVMSVIKVGTGVQTLSGINTYTGPTLVSAGELRVNGSIAASSSVTVNAGAKLSGSGIVSTVSFAGGSILSPGNSPGILNTGSATSAADVLIEVGGPTAGNGTGFHDQINTTGTLTLNGGVLSVSLINGYLPTAGNTFDIWLNDGADPIAGTGTFTALPEGSQIPIPETANAADFWTISYAGNTGNDIRLTYVPEPGTSSLALIAGALALNRRRRRSR